jgi:hypothetical protein
MVWFRVKDNGQISFQVILDSIGLKDQELVFVKMLDGFYRIELNGLLIQSCKIYI